MVEDAEQILDADPSLKARFECSFKLKDDPRILRCGRFLRKYSLDEFPQFFSILAGRISFVGPRAITPAARERYGDLAPKLLSVKPGLTGFWQVMGRQTTTFEEKIQMDMFYIDHWSIWLDLVILAKTFWQVCAPREPIEVMAAGKELQDKVCLIAGASGAIGSAVAERFHSEGACLALGCRTHATSSCLARRIDAHRVLHLQFDVRSWHEVRNAVDQDARSLWSFRRARQLYRRSRTDRPGAHGCARRVGVELSK